MYSTIARLLGFCAFAVGLTLQCMTVATAANYSVPLQAVIPKVTKAITIDGRICEDEYRDALCTPVEYFNPDPANRAGQFFYLWDESALYVALRTLDQKPYAAETKFWEGDAVEFYLDTRRDNDFLGAEWPHEPNSGAVHCFFTAMEREKVHPRFLLRPGYEQAIRQKGIELAGRRFESGLELEVRIPWSNFPNFKPTSGEVIGLDTELSYSDGEGRTFRSFVFGNPLSVHLPANLGGVKLADHMGLPELQLSGPVMMPVRIDVPWNQSTLPLQVKGEIAVPPNMAGKIGKIAFHVIDLEGKPLGKFPADNVVNLDSGHLFARREAFWPMTLAAPGHYQVYAVIEDPDGHEIGRVAPKLVSVNLVQGY
jgi:hypothetical protein